MMVFSDTLLPLGRRRLRLVPLRSASVATVTQNPSNVRGSSPQHRGLYPLGVNTPSRGIFFIDKWWKLYGLVDVDSRDIPLSGT